MLVKYTYNQLLKTSGLIPLVKTILITQGQQNELLTVEFSMLIKFGQKNTLVFSLNTDPSFKLHLNW